LRAAAHLFPAATVTGKGLDIKPSDNMEMLRALGRDPLVIKATRIDTIYGLTNLMDTAYTHAMRFPVPVLLLYGAHDEIIPPSAMCRYLENFLETGLPSHSMVLYPGGYHMLTRDLQAAFVLQDIAAWVVGQRVALPSGHAVASDSARFQEMCDGYGKNGE
jgi:alpha-beta hydrolase superfamily lysophospholipase